MYIESSAGGTDASAAKLTNLFQLGRAHASYDYVPEMWWVLAAQFITLIALLIVVVVI